jgi:hypothetical protein
MRKVLPVRVPVYIDAELISGQRSFAGMIGNLSLDGAFVETIPTKTLTPFFPGKSIDLKFLLSSKNTINLSCKIIWLYSKKDESAGFINSMGLKIVAPPGPYMKYLQSL